MSVFSKLCTSGWCVAWRKRVYADVFSAKGAFNIIKNPKDAWVADPFPFEYKGELYIFGEFFDLKNGRGSIAYCMPEKPDCHWVKVIDEPYHMSYPYIFCRGDEIYIMPETVQNQTIQLYRSVHFPDTWEKQKVLRQDVPYVDVTPFPENELHQALAYVVDPNIFKSELWLISLDKDTADCQLTVSCPEIRRPGGYVSEEKHVRVAQDSAVGYGDGLVFFHYAFNQSGAYEEQEILRVYTKDLTFTENIRCDGVHTYNCSEHYECVDLRINQFLLRNCLRKLKNKIFSR